MRRLFKGWRSGNTVSLDVRTKGGDIRQVSMQIGDTEMDPPVSRVFADRPRKTGYLYLESFNDANHRAAGPPGAEREAGRHHGQLAAGVAHEINNPLAVILGYARLLQKRAEGPLLDELRIVEDEAIRARDIVQEMLDLSAVQILAVTVAFFVLEIPLARWAFRLGLRERPY